MVPSGGRRRALSVVACAAALAVAGGLVWGASQAAFSATAGNGPNTVASGSVVLSDDDSGTAAVQAGNLAPGQRSDRCVTVSYGGSLPAAVDLWASAGGGALAADVELQIVEGRGPTGPDCAGFTPVQVVYSGTVAGLRATATSAATGLGGFAPGGAGADRVYRIESGLRAGAGNGVQGASASLDLTWTARSTGPAGLTGFGGNAYGQLGDGTLINRSAPSVVSSGASTAGWTDVTTLWVSSCGLRHPGTLWCWGWNPVYQLGLGDTADRTVPTRVGVEQDWTHVSGGALHGCGLRAGGQLWCWGHGPHGELGLGATASAPVPTRVGTATWRHVAAGTGYTCGVQTDSSLWCWGGNGQGQLGLGDTTDRNTPTRVGLASWSTVDVESVTGCGIQVDHSRWCWGENTDGQLGRGDTTASLVPVRSDTLRWSTISVGDRSVCGILDTGRLMCWGWNANGLLGVGDAINRTVPTAVGTATTWSRAETAYFHTCATRVDRSLWCWGGNAYGETATAPGVSLLVPTLVPGVSASALARMHSGGYQTLVVDRL